MFRGTINTEGRPKGTPNKATAEVRKAFQSLVENNLPQLEKDLKQLEPRERINAILGIAKFVLPQLKATEITDRSAERVQPIKISFYEGD